MKTMTTDQMIAELQANWDRVVVAELKTTPVPVCPWYVQFFYEESGMHWQCGRDSGRTRDEAVAEAYRRLSY